MGDRWYDFEWLSFRGNNRRNSSKAVEKLIEPVAGLLSGNDLLEDDGRRLNDEEIRVYILDRLSKRGSRNDLTVEVCRLTGKNWQQAERLVQEVSQQSQSHILKKLNWLMLPASIGILLLGLLISFSAFFAPDMETVYVSIVYGLPFIIAGLIGILRPLLKIQKAKANEKKIAARKKRR